MATPNTATPPPAKRTIPDSITVVSHSNLYYWWWVWAFALVLSAVSFFPFMGGSHLATVPADTKRGEVTKEGWVQEVKGVNPTTKEKVLGKEGKLKKGDPILYTDDEKTDISQLEVTRCTVSTSRTPGVIFCFVLLIVIGITNIPMRGLWSLIVGITLIFLIIILSLVRAWDYILEHGGSLDIRLSTGAYFVVGLILLGVWILTFFLYDPQTYMVFTPGSFRVRLEIGEGETAYDTRGMTIQKVRSDFFRHWVLGLGSGDLIIRTSGAQTHEFHLNNVLFVNRKVKLIEEMVRTHKEVMG